MFHLTAAFPQFVMCRFPLIRSRRAPGRSRIPRTRIREWRHTLPDLPDTPPRKHAFPPLMKGPMKAVHLKDDPDFKWDIVQLSFASRAVEMTVNMTLTSWHTCIRTNCPSCPLTVYFKLFSKVAPTCFPSTCTAYPTVKRFRKLRATKLARFSERP